jgi:hypothetical protein
VVLFVGDDWAEDHHDVEVLDESGRRLARARLPEGMAGMSRLHELLAEHLDESAIDSETGTLAAGEVMVGTETDRGPWVAALIAAGYRVFAINPMSVARFRERHSTSGAKSDPGDAHVLGEIVRLDRAHHRPVAGDSGQVEGLKLVARAVAPVADLGADPAPAAAAPGAAGVLPRRARGTHGREAGARRPGCARTRRARRRPGPFRPAVPLEDRRHPHPRSSPRGRRQGRGDPGRPAGPGAASGGGDRAGVRHHRRLSGALIVGLNTQIPTLEEVVAQGCGRHPDAEIYLSQPGLGTVLGARVLAEFGDDPHRYRDHKARRNYAGTSPITRTSGRKTVVLAATPATAASATPSTSGRSAP